MNPKQFGCVFLDDFEVGRLSFGLVVYPILLNSMCFLVDGFFIFSTIRGVETPPTEDFALKFVLTIG